jgi:uncharacterized membrane protein HdeD (DUF308 family)
MDAHTPRDHLSTDRKLSHASRHLGAWLLVEGIVLALLGAAAIVLPIVAGLAVAVLLGWLLLAAGGVGLIATINVRGGAGTGWALLSALVAIVTGAVLLWNPWTGLVTLTLVLTAYFIVDGLTTIILAIAHRRRFAAGRWEWMLLNGIVDLVLAGIIVAGLPGTLTWVLGLIVGIDMIVGGAALVAMGAAARSRAA